MKRPLTVAAIFGLLGGLALAGVAAAGVKDHGSESIECGDGTLAWSPTALWPPNHKYRDIPITYTDDDGGMVSLTITMNPHNEMVDDTTEINGTGNTPAATDSVGGAGMDSDGDVTVTAKARAERSGHKNDDGGRVYEFDYDANDNGDGGCESDTMTEGDGILIFVPHDCRDGACKPAESSGDEGGGSDGGGSDGGGEAPAPPAPALPESVPAPPALPELPAAVPSLGL